jgi:hypothetical protein
MNKLTTSLLYSSSFIFFAITGQSQTVTQNGIKLDGSKHMLVIRDGLSNGILTGTIQPLGNENIFGKGFLWKDEKGLECEVRMDRSSDALKCSLTFSTKVKGALRLLWVEFQSKANLGGRIKFWDGHWEREWDGKNTLQRNLLVETFPLACAYNDTQGLATAITPDIVTGYLETSIARQNGALALNYKTMVVVDEPKSQKITFVNYSFTPEFGWKNAVETYYEMYPQYFRPTPGVDQRIYGVDGALLTGYRSEDLAPHCARNMHIQVEWCFTPWKETGRWYVDKEHWRQGIDSILDIGGGRAAGVTWEEYEAAKKKRFAMGNRTTAIFYYCWAGGIMKDLLEQFPAARSMLYSRGKYELTTYGESARNDNRGKTYNAFPYGSLLGDFLEKEMKQVVEHYAVSGFAIDNAYYDYDDYCPAQSNFGVGRIFNEQGRVGTPNIITQLATADSVHKLTRDGKRMAAYINACIGNFVAFPCFHGDIVMFEGYPSDGVFRAPLLRLMCGQKPMNFHRGYPTEDTATIKWNLYHRDTEAREIIDAGLHHLILLYGLQYGITPYYALDCWLRAGNRTIKSIPADFFSKWQPTMLAISKAGWRCVPAVKPTLPEKLWIGRFGKGADTIITISNPTRETVKDDLEIISSYIGTNKYLFVPEGGLTLKQKISAMSAKFSVALQPKEIILIRAYEFEGANNITVSTIKDVASGNIAMNFESGAVTEVKGNRSDFDGNMVVNAADTGMKTDLSADGHGFSVAVHGKSNLVLHTVPGVFVSDEDKKIASFFSLEEAQDTGKQPLIVIPEHTFPNEETIAGMIDRYYPYVEACRQRSPGRNWLPGGSGNLNTRFDDIWKMQIVKRNNIMRAPAKQIFIGSFASYPDLKAKLSQTETDDILCNRHGFVKLFHDEGILWIGGNDDEATLKAGYRYLEIMDKAVPR